MSYSFGILKPDCLQKGLVNKAFSLITNRGLKIVLKHRLKLTRTDVELIYERCRSADFFEALIEFMTSGDVILFIVKSNDNDAIKILNSVTGHTDPKMAKSNTLRHLGEDKCRNISHSTMNKKSLLSELKHFFDDQKIANLLT